MDDCVCVCVCSLFIECHSYLQIVSHCVFLPGLMLCPFHPRRHREFDKYSTRKCHGALEKTTNSLPPILPLNLCEFINWSVYLFYFIHMPSCAKWTFFFKGQWTLNCQYHTTFLFIFPLQNNNNNNKSNENVVLSKVSCLYMCFVRLALFYFNQIEEKDRSKIDFGDFAEIPCVMASNWSCHSYL